MADHPNNAPDSGSQSRGPSIRGARDVVIMRVDLRVPAGANCLSFDFRFLSEEYPEFVGDAFNDAFIAELGHSTWTAATKQDPTIKAPDNFAVDGTGSPIRINKVGATSMRSAYAKGTTYDGATRRLRASTRIRPGNRRLYLSIFDQGDRIYDSAVFLDNLRTSHAKACSTGVRAAS
ncbi:choice-of-anchor L domain-containing protein [Baekduia soli]|nr:choice-of-anchor L domain-containing protein [Baekduia soli]